MKKVLVISRNAWANNISTGNTLSNFFANWEIDKIANIYCRNEKIDNNICKKYYRITEIDLINSLKNRSDAGCRIDADADIDTREIEATKKIYSTLRNHRFVFLLWLRELLWKIGKWKNERLIEFLKSFAPDIIYMPIYDCLYMHNILAYCAKITGAKVVLFTGDDMYSMRQFSLSPLYWINRLLLRKKIRDSVRISSKRYCLTYEQAKEYEQYFSKPFDILIKETKCSGFQREEHKERDYLRLVYTGNIDKGRFNTICAIGKTLNVLDGFVLDLYSGSKLTASMKRRLEVYKKVAFKGEITPDEVQIQQRDADVAVHVEGFGIKERLRNRLSFSTKIVDYLSNGKCIFAVGWEKSSSIKFLKDHGIACVATDKKSIAKSLNDLRTSEYRVELAQKAYTFAQEHLSPGTNYRKLSRDFEEIAD